MFSEHGCLKCCRHQGEVTTNFNELQVKIARNEYNEQPPSIFINIHGGQTVLKEIKQHDSSDIQWSNE